MADAVTLAEAAAALGKDTSTIRRWIQRGAPCIKPGERGREGALVNLDDIRLWRSGVSAISEDAVLEKVATALLDCIKRDAVHERAGITERQAAIVLLLAFQRYFRNTRHRQIDKEDKLPEAIEHICTFAVK